MFISRRLSAWVGYMRCSKTSWVRNRPAASLTSRTCRWELTRRKGIKLPQRDVLGLHENAARAAGDASFGLKLGQRMHPEDFGWFARYAVQAPDLAGMLSRYQRGMHYHQNGSAVECSRQGDLVRFSYRLTEPWSVGRRNHADHCVVPFMESVRRYLGDRWCPLWVELEADRGPWSKAAEDFFQAPVHHGCQANSLIIDAADLRCRNRQVTPIEKRLSIFDLRRMVGDKPPETFVEQVRALVLLRLEDRRTDIGGFAARMGVTSRTLQRKLAAEGTSYRAIVDRVRHQRSAELLADGTNSVVDIATTLGYSDDAHFIRAFRRWEGRTPRSAWWAGRKSG